MAWRVVSAGMTGLRRRPPPSPLRRGGPGGRGLGSRRPETSPPYPPSTAGRGEPDTDSTPIVTVDSTRPATGPPRMSAKGPVHEPTPSQDQARHRAGLPVGA